METVSQLEPQADDRVPIIGRDLKGCGTRTLHYHCQSLQSHLFSSGIATMQAAPLTYEPVASIQFLPCLLIWLCIGSCQTRIRLTCLLYDLKTNYKSVAVCNILIWFMEYFCSGAHTCMIL
jgi:hypothetical protein